ncbi:uncharacterized protein K452DRAFT_302248 [Aplosporella prunicola CBS 121167]|uniref:Uncharacterized protein n=1 Tax=Aplosporella prunicola CBS 121167 TaxID=1176127 RepID=A0A6A6B244_9PEZI|nr:uncharacterized protein K452DRAFT_302248 [Aplosporella prunicola CBS 121167]KAF2137087.1 hypothetical protein K452DRAFT_302248 [Aplosporella prunicola CBS 121167]
MFAHLTTVLAIAGAVSAASSTSAAASSTTSFSSAVISFPFVDPFHEATYVPDSGISGRIIDVQSSRTTLVFSCQTTAKSVDDYFNNKVGALCADKDDDSKEVEVIYGDGFFGMPIIQKLDNAGKTTAHFDLGCAVTASPAKNDASITAKSDPVCTYDLKGNKNAKEFQEQLECYQDNVAGPISAQMQSTLNTASVDACISSISAAKGTPTQALVTHPASAVRYWTVTVTDVPTNVTLAASQTAKNGAAGSSFGVGSSAAGVLGLLAVVLGL